MSQIKFTPEDYNSPISLKDLQEMFRELFDGDVHEAKEFLHSLRRQRPYQSLHWHLAAGIHLMRLYRRYEPNKRKSEIARHILQVDAINLFDKTSENANEALES